MKILKEFREFAVKGNVIDMAVGIIIGGAFGKIVASLVNDVIMPPIGLLIGGIDFSEFAITIKEATAETKAITVNYGVFIMAVINFTIIAFSIFMVINLINKMKKKEAAAPAPLTQKICPECIMSIPVEAKKCAFCLTVQSDKQ